MKCPKCNKDIDRVIVCVKATQIGHLNEQGEIEDYTDIEVEETLKTLCPECMIEIDVGVEK